MVAMFTHTACRSLMDDLSSQLEASAKAVLPATERLVDEQR
jgi:hypothetical protein